MNPDFLPPYLDAFELSPWPTGPALDPREGSTKKPKNYHSNYRHARKRNKRNKLAAKSRRGNRG